MGNYTNVLESDPAAVFGRDNPQLVVTVDVHDCPTGVMDKIDAHRNGGVLHRAFSIFVFDSVGRLLLQRRACCKYHFGGFWTNTCCGHAVAGEELALTAPIRLWQEMGICVELREVAQFTYSATDTESGLTEREIDHVFVGTFDGVPQPDRAEVEEWRWIEPAELQRELVNMPQHFTPWFNLGLDRLQETKLNRN